MDSFKETLNQLAAEESSVTEDFQVAMLLASFGDTNSSPFEYAILSLRAVQENLDEKRATATLLSEYY